MFCFMKKGRIVNWNERWKHGVQIDNGVDFEMNQNADYFKSNFNEITSKYELFLYPHFIVCLQDSIISSILPLFANCLKFTQTLQSGI